MMKISNAIAIFPTLSSATAFAPKKTPQLKSQAKSSVKSDQANIKPLFDPFGLYPENSEERKNGRLQHLEPRMGLLGNRSSGKLERTYSEGSGLFIEEEETFTRQVVGEATISVNRPSSAPNLGRARRSDSEGSSHSGYLKTCSMANFYYRKEPSFGSSEDTGMHTTASDPILDREVITGEAVKQQVPHHHRRRSKSYGELL